MSTRKIAVNRSLVGVLAVGTLVIGVVGWVFGDGSASNVGFYAAFLRMGALLAAFWLALPSKHRDAAWANISPWTFGAVVILILMLVRRPQIFVPLIAVLAVAALFLRPRRR